MQTYGYARVSTINQKLDRQLEEFKNFNIPRKNIYSDKISGKDFIRPNYQKMLKKLKKNDLLIIQSIDRLGRNYDMIIQEWNQITNVIQANILVIDMPLLDTREKNNTLTGKFISNLVLQILSYVAENERKNIRKRQAEGIKLAQQKGVKFGRPKTTISPFLIELFTSYNQKIMSLDEVSKLSNYSKQSFLYHYKNFLKRT